MVGVEEPLNIDTYDGSFDIQVPILAKSSKGLNAHASHKKAVSARPQDDKSPVPSSSTDNSGVQFKELFKKLQHYIDLRFADISEERVPKGKRPLQMEESLVPKKGRMV